MTDETEQVAAAPSLGEVLTEAREKAGLSSCDIAERMNLKLAVIEALESNDLSELPDTIFVRGYLKAYARLVNLPEEQALSAYASLEGEAQAEQGMQSFSRRTSRERTNSRIMWITYFIVLVFIGLVVMWWWQKDQGLELPGTTQPESPQEQVLPAVEPTQSISESSTLSAEESSVPASQDDSMPEEPAIEISPQPLENESAPIIPESNVDKMLQEVDQGQPAEAVSVDAADSELPWVELTFSANCWIKVEDATGDVVAEGEKTPERIVRFQGVPPFKAIFGAPATVSVTYAGEPVEFKIKDPERPLRLTIPTSE